MEHLSYKDRLRDHNLFRLEKTKLQADFNAAFWYLKSSYKENRD